MVVCDVRLLIIMSQPTYIIWGLGQFVFTMREGGLGFFEGGNAKKGVSRFEIGTQATFVEDKWSLHYCHLCSLIMIKATTKTTITLFTLSKRIIRQKRV